MATCTALAGPPPSIVRSMVELLERLTSRGLSVGRNAVVAENGLSRLRPNLTAEIEESFARLKQELGPEGLRALAPRALENRVIDDVVKQLSPAAENRIMFFPEEELPPSARELFLRGETPLVRRPLSQSEKWRRSSVAPGAPRGAVWEHPLARADLPKFLRGVGHDWAQIADVLSAFKGPVKIVEVRKTITAQRFFGGDSQPIGRWLFNEGLTPHARQRLALPLRNEAASLAVLNIPAGTRLVCGRAAPMFGQRGGALQLYAPDTTGFELVQTWLRAAPSPAASAATRAAGAASGAARTAGAVAPGAAGAAAAGVSVAAMGASGAPGSSSLAVGAIAVAGGVLIVPLAVRAVAQASHAAP
jgi:hypothetical protein